MNTFNNQGYFGDAKLTSTSFKSVTKSLLRHQLF